MADIIAQLQRFPLVAILRGITTDEVSDAGQTLIEEGFGVIEVPLNSPDPIASIARMVELFADKAVIGAGTVMSADDVQAIHDVGGTLIISPHLDAQVVEAAKRLGMTCIPGVATPSEAFQALRLGADALKLFPAEAMPPPVVKAWRAVVPADALLLPVGSITPDNMIGYWHAGASGFGLGSALFQPGMPVTELRGRAQKFAEALYEVKRDTRPRR